jgi:VWFA-related protein
LVAGETGEVAVLAFDHRVQTLTGFTSNQDEIKAAFGKLKPGSVNHQLDDAAMEGINMLRNRGKERKKILLLIAETRDQGSAFNPRDVLTNAEFSDVVIYSVNMSTLLNSMTSKSEPNRPNPIPPEFRSPLPMGTPRTLTTDAQTNMGNYTPAIKELYTQIKAIFVPNPLEVYTKETGGREHNFATMSGLEEAIGMIGREIHSQYMLTYLPSNRNEGGYHEITVRVSKPGMLVRTRGGYWIAPNGPSSAPAKK